MPPLSIFPTGLLWSGPAIAVRATVEQLSDGDFLCTGPMFGGLTAHLGPMARLRVRRGGGDLTIVVGTNRAQNADVDPGPPAI